MDSPPATASVADLRGRIDILMPADRRRLARLLDRARRQRDPGARDGELARLETALHDAEGRLERRRAAVPPIRYPDQLPVSRRRDEIAAAIRDHQVVVIAGETGSGKTTQLPKICLELGRGITGMIGHTQPRRIAARTVAERIAEELGTPLGSTVGWKVRFTDQVSGETLVKLMTDGILLAEIQADPALRAYDTIIIDEAHERSLNIDFILGHLAGLLPRRPDLKLIITSATIDPYRFARHFARDGVDAPVIEVSGRTYPVEIRYRPLVDPDDPAAPERDQVQGVLDAVDELRAEGPGDILVFFSGEREIRDAADALIAADLPRTEVLPLYGRLSVAEQHRVFQPPRVPGDRRIVLATNVAETSLTVPGISYVIDPGTARISRYSHRTKVQRLPIEPISQASAAQRAGRCGRVSDGICVRLYSQADVDSRPEFTDPEILRTNLASVILQLIAARLGEIETFPFVDPPDRRGIADGTALLEELAAVRREEPGGRRVLTDIGRSLARLPVDPRIARMVVAADRLGCVREVLVIAAALSVQDPRERPAEAQQAADTAHARFADPSSDFLAYLNLWRHLRERQKALSGNQFRRLCRTEFLNYLRVREWQDVHAQLRQIADQLGMTRQRDELPAWPGPGEPDPAGGGIDGRGVHTAILAGFLSHVGFREGAEREFAGARGARFAVFPGSALFRKPPRWVVAAELVETSRLWARVAARIEPEWVEPIAEHLVKRSYSEPHWSRKRGSAVAVERVTLYGLPLVVGRTVGYGRVDPELSRELFIRHALVEGDWETGHAFFRANRALLADVEELENRARRRDILVDDEALFAFYDAKIPADVVSARHFDSWWKRTRRREPTLLDFDPAMLVNDRAGALRQEDFPDTWSGGEHLTLPLSYAFQPGSASDGVTVQVPLPALTGVQAREFDWQVPGLRLELVTELIRSLPKPIRRTLGPAPDAARAALAALRPGTEPLLDGLERELLAQRGVRVPRSAWQLDRVPEHLRVTFEVVGDDGSTVAAGKDLDGLKARLRGQVRESLTAGVTEELRRNGVRDWEFGTLPRAVGQQRDGFTVTAYPALVDEGSTVGVQIFDTEIEAGRAMRRGTRRLLALTVPSPVKAVVRGLSNQDKLVLSANPHGGVPALLADCVDCALDSLVAAGGGPAWDEAGFARLRESVRAGLPAATLEVCGRVRAVLAAWQDVRARLADPPRGAMFTASLDDVRAQVGRLVHAGFVTEAGRERLPHLVRYLRAVLARLEKLPRDPVRDTERARAVGEFDEEYRVLVAELPADAPGRDRLPELRWMIEELRVSLFAQQLGTATPVSAQRVWRLIDELR